MAKPKKNSDNQPMKKPNDVNRSNDNKIDQDMPGFPHPPATPDIIKKKKGKPSDVDNAPD